MLLEYRSLNPDLEMLQTYSGEVFHLNEACIYVPREMMKSWLEFSRTIRKLELTNKELAVTLAVALTFRGKTGFLVSPASLPSSRLSLNVCFTLTLSFRQATQYRTSHSIQYHQKIKL